jgi:lipoprotein-anchoring transpeptidase ErfK/SrfK
MGPKRQPPSNAALIWWALVVVVAGIIGWILWHTAQKPPATVAEFPKRTNSFDTARATNLLKWVDTNKYVAPPPPATNIILPPRTNRVATNILVLPPRTNRPAPQQTNTVAIKPAEQEEEDRPVRNILEAQIALARQAISCGPIDGVAGYQTQAALRAFQRENEIAETGVLDATTRETLHIADPVFTTYTVTAADLARLHPVPDTWLGKSEVASLDYETLLELVAEKHQSSQNLIRSLNPSINWTNVAAGAAIKAPYVPAPPSKEKAAFVRIQLSAKVLEAFDSETNLIAHFPCSIAARVEKRPAGKLAVVTGAANPNYSFDPAVFPESEEAQRIGRKLIIPPGPNNPVGVAWISLDKPGYGIHGTPRPEQVGRTESHGCFRLANWNAEYLLKIVWAGMPVYVEP